MNQNRSFKFNRVSTVLISIALLLVTLLGTAMASGTSVKEALSSACDVSYRVFVSDSSLDRFGAEMDARLAAELVAAECAANELVSRAGLQGIVQDTRLAQGLAAAKVAAVELARGHLSADRIARMIAAQETREAIKLAEILELQDSISLR